MSTKIGLADRIFLLQESSQTPQHIAVLGTFRLPPDAPPDYLQRLVAGFRGTPTFAPPFNYRLRSSAIKTVAPAFVVLRDDEVDLDYHFRHSALPRPGHERELGVLVSRLHSHALDLSRPLWEAHLIEGLAGGRFAIYFKIHHALMDGVEGAHRLQGTLSTSAADVELRPLWTIGPHRAALKRHAGSLVGRLTAPARGLWTQIGAAGSISRGAAGMLTQTISPGGEKMATPYKIPASPLNGRIGQQRRVATLGIEFERVHRVARGVDATINDVLLAACGGGLRCYLDELGARPDDGLLAGTPVSVRRGQADGANNAFTMAAMRLHTQIEDPVARINAIRRSSTLTKDSLNRLSKPAAENYGAMLMSPFIAQQLVGLAGHLKPPYNLVISNVPGPIAPQYLAGAELESMYPLAVLSHGTRLFIASLTVSGRMGIGFVGDPDSLPHLQRLAFYTRDAFGELETALALGHSPVAS